MWLAILKAPRTKMKLLILITLALFASGVLGYTYNARTLTMPDESPGCLKFCGCYPALRIGERSCGTGATCYVTECKYHNNNGEQCPYPADDKYNDLCLDEAPNNRYLCLSCATIGEL